MKFCSKLIIFCFVFCIYSCRDEETGYSIIPSIELVSAETVFNASSGRDSIILVKISYMDGDGDIGLSEDDSLPPFDLSSPFFFNLFVEFFEIKNGEKMPFLLPITFDTLRFDQRLPNLTPTGKRKSIEGEIVLKLPTVPFPEFKPDSVVFRIQLYDRALNPSNIIETDPIVIQH